MSNLQKRFLIMGILFSFVFVIVRYYSANPESTIGKDIHNNSSCIGCHGVMIGFSEAHAPDKIPCTSCHHGNSKTDIKELAHKDMFVVPGNLSNVSETCAKCHPGIDTRVKNSIMNTMSGIISVDKYLFHENDNLDSLFNIHHLGNETSAEHHLRNKCASCHIGNEKKSPHPITEKSRGGGCNACHLNYGPTALSDFDNYISSNKTILATAHPSLSLDISDDHCFGCHSRSGRISTNYEGWHESHTLAKDIKDKGQFRILEDGRILQKEAEDIHHALGLSCIDCHNSEEVMGDGNIYAHKEEAVKVKCINCHGNNQKTISYSGLSESNQRIIRLRKIDSIANFIKSNFNHEPIINVIKKDGSHWLIPKNGMKRLQLSTISSSCEKSVHQDLSCSSCHTQWAPQCITCHTSYSEDKDGYDLLSKKWVIGNWEEQGGHYFAEYPSLGVMEKKNGREISTFSPGMVLTHNTKESTQNEFNRLFAPTSAHTISKEGRTCRTCHLNPVALGYGRGELILNKAGQFTFKAMFKNGPDGLPEDAWISFLSNNPKQKATRTNSRPLNQEEQYNILKVGACLSCHSDNSKVSQLILDDYLTAFDRREATCIEFRKTEYFPFNNHY